MSKRANPAVVGGFVLGGLALAVAGIVFFGSGRLFADIDTFVIYFDGSVNGLQLGSRVKLDGVPIGAVTGIRAIANTGETLSFYTETTIEVDRKRFDRRGSSHGNDAERFRWLIEQGLRARLELESLITGQLYIAFRILPDSELRLLNLPGTRYPEVPAVPTTQQELQRTVKHVIERLDELPIEDIAQKLDSTLGGVDRFVNDPKLASALANLDGTLAEARGTTANLRRMVKDFDANIQPVTESVIRTLTQAQQMLETVQTSIEPSSPLGYQLAVTLREVSDAARAFRVLADFLEQNPNSIVFGRTTAEP